MTILKPIFNLKHKYIDTQYSLTNINVKIWISKKTYPTLAHQQNHIKYQHLLIELRNY